MEIMASSRRDRLRAETSAEIKAVALKLMTQGGPDAVSLRAIAREMGMSAGAIYSYYDTRDVLISALIADVFTSYLDTVEAARDSRPAADAAGRILAWAQASRDWALTNPEGFRLIYRNPVPDYEPPEGSASAEAEHRACIALTGLVATAWPHAEPLQSAGGHQWSDFDPRPVADVRHHFPDLPPAAFALALRIWGRMHGLVALEIYGHLRGKTRDPGRLYSAEMLDLITSLGLEPPR